MYSGGATYSDIADYLGMSVGGARSMVLRSMRNTFAPPEDIDEWRKDKIATLEALIERMWPNASDPKVAQAIIRSIDKQADLMGVARYTHNETTITVEHVRAYRDQIAQRLEVIQGELVGESSTAR